MPIIHNLPHWNFFRILERDLEACFRYVEPNESHFGVYSDEFAKLILVACSEIENALGVLASSVNKTHSCRTLPDFSSVILGEFNHLPTINISLPRYGLNLQPWRGWVEQSPDWWRNGYNKIKHDRVGNPEAATLERALNSVAGLQTVLLYLYHYKYRVCILPHENSPHLMEPDLDPDDMKGTAMGWSFQLPDYLHVKQNRGEV